MAVQSTVATPIKVRKLGHVVYEVSDIERSTQFWTEIMGFRVVDTNPQGMVFLHTQGDHHGIALVPAKGKTGLAKDGLAIHHWAMEVDSIETLFKARDFLKSRGIAITYEGRRGPGCNIGVEFKDPDGYSVEIYCGMDQIDENGRPRPADQFRRATSLEQAVAEPLKPTW